MSSCGRGGGRFRVDLFYFNFIVDNAAWFPLHINHKEILAIVLAAKRWAPCWTNHRVIIHSDNQAAVQIINKGTTANEVMMDELRHLFWLSALYNFHLSAVYIEGSRNMIADAVSRLHERANLLLFRSILRDRFPHCGWLSLSRSHVWLQWLFRLFQVYAIHVWPDTCRRKFMNCQYMGYRPVPTDMDHLLQYAAFLARSLKASSIGGYLSIIGLLHKEFGLPNPLLTGINRSKGLTPYQKQPITPVMLHSFYFIRISRLKFAKFKEYFKNKPEAGILKRI